jgi:hypothetical protein
MRETTTSNVTCAMIQPRMPAAVARSAVSITSWRAIRNRPAPIAVRIASSRTRSARRASRRLTTLTQARAKRVTTAANTSRSTVREDFVKSSASGVIVTPSKALSVGPFPGT